MYVVVLLLLHASLCCSAELSTIIMCIIVSITGIYEFGYIVHVHSSSPPSNIKFSDMNRNDYGIELYLARRTT